MNTLKVHGLLCERYPSHFLDFTHKITNPIFGTPCSYSNTVMRSPLKDKIQNAINRAINDCNHYNDYNNNGGDGALIVGGRRRNRKKKNKKNGQKKKKSPSLESIKARLSPSGCRKGGKEQENAPLIDEGDNENKENENEENMPFGFSKKKKEVTEAENAVPNDDVSSKTDDVKGITEADDVGHKNEVVQNGEVAGETEKGLKEDNKSNDVTEKVEQEVKVNGVVSELASEPATRIEIVKADGKTVVTFAAEPEKDAAQPTQGDDGALSTEKSEKSRLINKSESGESKFKDQQPGFLCCAIL